MQIYIPEQSPTLALRCSIHVPAPVIGISASLIQTPLPPTPRVHSTPLPLSNVVTVSVNQLVADFYPINLLKSLTDAQWAALQSIQLVSPVHVHTPTGHIGTLHGSFAGQHITALDAFLFLQIISASPLDLHSALSGLSLDAKTHIKAAFYRRNAVSPSVCDIAWRRFISGQYAAGGPLGIDLIFGSSEVWEFELLSLAGYSVVHIANSNSISS